MEPTVEFIGGTHFFNAVTQVLKCPRCGGENLHQGTVVVYSKTDGDYGTCTIIADGLPSAYRLTGRVPNDPSPYRDALTIEFTCEYGDHKSILQIWQHKGNTFVAWKVTGK